MVNLAGQSVSEDRAAASENLWDRLKAGDRHALARLLTWISEDRLPSTLLDRLRAHKRRATAIAITGNGGVGKSSLVGRLIEHVRGLGKKVGVLACDPESPLTGGALLGDRARMPSLPDEGLFIRSVTSSRSGEAIAHHLDLMILAMDAFGLEVILIETAGAGQADTAIRDFADLVVLLVQPESGDDLQWQKAGLIEVADILVVHKADLPTTDRMESQLRSMVNLPGCKEVPIVRVSSLKGTGLPELWKTLEEEKQIKQNKENRENKQIKQIEKIKGPALGLASNLWKIVRERLADRFQEMSGTQPIAVLAGRLDRGEVNEDQATDELLGLLRNASGPCGP